MENKPKKPIPYGSNSLRLSPKELLLVVALFIIANTVRITMYTRRLEISIMKAVGATNSFIRWPFLI